jgi:hypothetical protein
MANAQKKIDFDCLNFKDVAKIHESGK